MKDIWVPVSGALAQQKKVEVIANNVANANTPGHKRDNIVFEEYLAALKRSTDINLPNKEWEAEDYYKTNGAEKAQVRIAGTFTDFRNGQLRNTGSQFDMALQGPGFFEILSKNGIRYSRNGIFSLSVDGQLVNSQGDLVLSKQSSSLVPIPPKTRAIKLPPGVITVNAQGEIFSNNNKISQLSIVEFKDIHAIKKEDNSYFTNHHPNNLIRNNIKSTVHQGFLEGSNVNAISEMSELIKAHRHFESIQKAIKAYDNMAAKSVNEIIKF